MKAIVLMLLMTGSAEAQLRPRHQFAVTGEQVTRAISKALAQQGYAGEAKVALLADVLATQAEPVLEVQSIERAAGDRTTVRVACRERGVCLPFYASVQWPGALLQPAGKVAASATAPVLMPVGAAGTLVMEDGRAEVRVSVISLESGRAGQVIRVASADRKRVYRAEVLSAGLVRGSF